MKYRIPNIAEALRGERHRQGKTQQGVADDARLPQARISMAENHGDLRISTLQQIAGALDLVVMLVPRKAAPLVRDVIRSLP